MVSLGRFASIAEGRRWMRSMSDIVQYEPHPSGDWDKAAVRLKTYSEMAQSW